LLNLLTSGRVNESIKGEDVLVNEAQKVKISSTEQLVEASSRGNRDAFDELVELYQRQAMQVAISILGNADEASEAVQTGFVKAYLGINKLRDPKYFEIWLLRIISNTAISHRKAAKRRAEATKAVECRSKQINTFSPEDTVDTNELREAIQRAMLKLSKKEAQAITLFGLEYLSQEQVAEIMGCSIGAVKWHVFRARKKLKVLLRKYLE
jgi:RNA polymerase sigma-70 factor (ECF subfamily)